MGILGKPYEAERAINKAPKAGPHWHGGEAGRAWPSWGVRGREAHEGGAAVCVTSSGVGRAWFKTASASQMVEMDSGRPVRR